MRYGHALHAARYGEPHRGGVHDEPDARTQPPADAPISAPAAVNGHEREGSVASSSSGWLPFPFGDFPRPSSEVTTPSSSSLFQPTPPPEPDPGLEVAVEGYTPRAEDAALAAGL